MAPRPQATRPPAATRFEQVPDRSAGVAPSGFSAVPMHARPGRIWRGEIPGQVAGLVEYRVRATDRNGNLGASALKDFTANGPGGLVYCTAGTTSDGCLATMSAAGVPSLGAVSGYVLVSSNLENQRTGAHSRGVSGRTLVVWNGGSSRVCVRSPVQRMASSVSGGTTGACDGLRADDWLAYLAAHPGSLGQPFLSGVTVNAQCWFRDPTAPGGTHLSDGIEFVTLP